MAASYSADQIAAAKESWAFWKAKGAPAWVCASLLADEDGETSFEWWLWGDHHEASGAAQWHKARRDIILANLKIDVWASDHPSQLLAMYGEMTAPWSSYKHVWAALLATADIAGAVTVLVQKYEQSGSQARDIARRSDLAAYWSNFAASQGW